jgi:hypothetical protein
LGWTWRARRKGVGRVWDMNPLKFFAAIGITTTGCSTQTTAHSRNLYPLNA